MPNNGFDRTLEKRAIERLSMQVSEVVWKDYMCPKCKAYGETIRIQHPYHYFDLLRQIRYLLEKGTLQLDSGSCDLTEIREDAPFPDDHIEHYFSCIACGQRFRIGVETYHGSDGCWEPIGPNEGAK